MSAWRRELHGAAELTNLVPQERGFLLKVLMPRWTEEFQERARSLHGHPAPCVESRRAHGSVTVAAHLCQRFRNEIGLKICSKNKTRLQLRETGTIW